jgi:uncharacterized membrane protein
MIVIVVAVIFDMLSVTRSRPMPVCSRHTIAGQQLRIIIVIVAAVTIIYSVIAPVGVTDTILLLSMVTT